MAAAEEEEEWEDGRSVMPEEEDGDIEDVPPPPLLGRNFGSEDEDEDEAGSLNSQSQWWPRSFRYVRPRVVHSLRSHSCLESRKPRAILFRND
jgi:hypothetical protein